MGKIVNRSLILSILVLVFLFLFSCNSNKKTNEYYTSIHEFEKLVNIQVKPKSIKWNLTKLVDSRTEEGPVLIISILEMENLDENFKAKYIKNESDIKAKIYLDPKHVEKWFPRGIKENLYMEDGYYRVKSNVYSGAKLINNTIQQSYFFISENDEIFLMIQTEGSQNPF